MNRRLARAIVRRYPAAWRERYEAEVLDMIASSPVSARDIGEFFSQLLLEYAHAVLDVEHSQRTLFKVGVIKTCVVVGFTFATMGAARLAGRPPADTNSEWLVLAIALTFWGLLGALRFGHFRTQRSRAVDDQEPFPKWIALSALPLHFLVAALWFWVAPEDTARGRPALMWWAMAWNHFFVVGSITGWLMSQIWPDQRLLDALMTAEVAEQNLTVARNWIVSCHEWNAKGVSSPTADAEAMLAEWTSKRAKAQATLQRFGYRSRFTA